MGFFHFIDVQMLKSMLIDFLCTFTEYSLIHSLISPPEIISKLSIKGLRMIYFTSFVSTSTVKDRWKLCLPHNAVLTLIIVEYHTECDSFLLFINNPKAYRAALWKTILIWDLMCRVLILLQFQPYSCQRHTSTHFLETNEQRYWLILHINCVYCVTNISIFTDWYKWITL